MQKMQSKDLWDVQSLPEPMTDLQCIVWNNQFIILGSQDNPNCYSTPCFRSKNAKLKWKQIHSLTFSDDPYGHAVVSMDNKAFYFDGINDDLQTCNFMENTPYKWHTETSNLELDFELGLRAIAINNLIFVTSGRMFYVLDPHKMAQRINIIALKKLK